MSTGGPYDPSDPTESTPPTEPIEPIEPIEPTVVGSTLPPDEVPPEGRRNIWPWVIGGLIAVIAIVLVILSMASDDDDDDTVATATSTTAVVETSTTESPATTVTTKPAAPSTSAAPAVTVAPGLCKSSAPDDPDTTAQVVYQAYTLGDEDCADKLMTASARSELFNIPGKGQGWTFEGCTDQDQPDPHTDCAFRFTGGATHFRMNYGTGGWEVYDVFQTTD